MGAKPKPQAVETAFEPLSPRQPAADPVARVARPGDLAAESPALKLQASLLESLSEPVLDRWSARRTAAFVVVTCGGFWVAAALLVRLASRALS